MNKLAVVKVGGVSGYMSAEGMAFIRLEDAAIGLGFTQTQIKNGRNYLSVRWERVDGYLQSFDVNLSPTNGGRPEFISEPIFYMLAMKASNGAAKAFQRKIAYEILPQIRQKGFYGTLTKENAMKLARKAGVTMDDYAKYKTGMSLTERIANERHEVKELMDWSTYRFSVSDVIVETDSTHGDILNMARKKKMDKNKELAAYVQGELRFTYQGRRVIESELPKKVTCVGRKAAGEPIQWF